MSGYGPTTLEEAKAFKSGTKSPVAYKRIFDLGPERVSLLNTYLMSETYSVEKIIKTIQEEWATWTDAKPATIRRQLMRYKVDYILPKQAQLAAKFTTDKNVARLAAVATRIEQNLDPLIEMDRVVRLQLDRVQKLAALEAESPGLFKDQTSNVALLTDQLEKLAKLQMDLGILKKVPAKIALSADLTDADLKFMESAKLHGVEVDATVEAMRYLQANNVLHSSAKSDETVEGEVVSAG